MRPGVERTGAGASNEAADAAYHEIRCRNDDVEKIAANTGIKPKNIRKIKAHLFYNEHLLDRYVNFGIPAVRARFESDSAIAAVWNRLIDGCFTDVDVLLLRHETAEAWYMRRHGPSYTQAHKRAQERFPAPDWTAPKSEETGCKSFKTVNG